MFIKAGKELSDFYKEIIADELNVKTVNFTDDVREFTSYTDIFTQLFQPVEVCCR